MSDGITDMSRGYDEDDSVIKYRLRKENNDLKIENEDLKTKLADLTLKMSYNKQTELIEFLREIYDGVKEEMTTETYHQSTRSEILFNLKTNIEEFAKNVKMLL